MIKYNLTIETNNSTFNLSGETTDKKLIDTFINNLLFPENTLNIPTPENTDIKHRESTVVTRPFNTTSRRTHRRWTEEEVQRLDILYKTKVCIKSVCKEFKVRATQIVGQMYGKLNVQFSDLPKNWQEAHRLELAIQKTLKEEEEES